MFAAQVAPGGRRALGHHGDDLVNDKFCRRRANAEGLRELHSGSTRIPCCQRCRLYFLISKYASTWPEWLMILSGFITFSMLLGSLIPYMIGQGKSAPVTVWRGR